MCDLIRTEFLSILPRNRYPNERTRKETCELLCSDFSIRHLFVPLPGRRVPRNGSMPPSGNPDLDVVGLYHFPSYDT